jgi:hypothetical protein
MLAKVWCLILNMLVRPVALLAQDRMYEWHWEMHPMWWWIWGIGDDGDDVSFLGAFYRRPCRGNPLAHWQR